MPHRPTPADRESADLLLCQHECKRLRARVAMLEVELDSLEERLRELQRAREIEEKG